MSEDTDDPVRRTEVDGVTTVLAARTGGRIAAGLFFRVGRADETLATSGITHLVEHLALHEHGVGDLHYNGATADMFTHFHVEGTAAHVVEYLNGVCAALRDLPIHRLEVEKEILRTESSGRSWGPSPNMALYRYGAQGYGLASYAEQGLSRIDEALVRDWAASHFTRQNAVLWITSDTVPEGLVLDLPDGRRNPQPTVTSALPQTPAWLGGQSDMVVLQAVVERSTAANLYSRVLAKALFQDLRQKGGYSYTATSDYQPRDADHAVIHAWADCLPEKREAVVGGLVDTLARLRLGTITDAELASAKNAALQSFDEPDLAAARLPAYAINLLVGHDNLTDAQLRAEIEATTPADLRAVAEEVHRTALVQVPALGLDWAGFVEAPQASADRVTGKEHRSLDPDLGPLVVGPDGVTLMAPPGPITVKFRETVAMQAYADGGRRLTGADGFSVDVEPTLHKLDAGVVQLIDSKVPAQAVVPLPARHPDRLPKPAPRAPSPKAAAARPAGVRGVLDQLWGAFLWFAAASLLLVAVTASVDPTADGTDLAAGIIVAVIFWVLFGLCAGAIYRRRRRG